jgi:hypothetical protein
MSMTVEFSFDDLPGLRSSLALLLDIVVEQALE